jgi:HlyD family secretion protein
MIQQKKHLWPFPTARHILRVAFLAGAVLLTGSLGCRKTLVREPETKKVAEVAVVRPERASLHWTVQQPADIKAFEQTPIIPKISGYVLKWNVDIGDHVKKGETLAVLWVPDMVAELNQRKAEVRQARKLIEVAEAHLASVAAQAEEARASVRRARAEAVYWKLQHDRTAKLAETAVVNPQVKDESWNRLEAAEAAVKEAEARVVRAQADSMESVATRNKSGVDVDVAQAAADRMQALLDYATLTAPFDGVVTQRNINTGDFVKPPGGVGEPPLYVVERRDLMRIFVEVPEADAVWVKAGTPAHIRIPILRHKEYCGDVKRMAYSLKRQSRTLLAEIDLPNPEDLLRPGMYAYAAIQVEQANVLTLPDSAVATRGNVNEGYLDFCFLVRDGKAWRTPIEVGSRGEGRVQVLKKHIDGAWLEFNSDDKFVQGQLATLADGQDVTLVANPRENIARSRTVPRSSVSGSENVPPPRTALSATVR